MTPESTKIYEELLRKNREKPFQSAKDYIEQQVLNDPRKRDIDVVVLIDGSSIPGTNLVCSLENMFVARDDSSGTFTHVPYGSIVKIISTLKG